MPDNKTEKFLQKLAPCIERGELEACVEEAARVAREMGIGAGEILDLSAKKGEVGKYDFAYVLALASMHDLENEYKTVAYCNAGLSAMYLEKVIEAERYFNKAINANPNYAVVHSNYGLFLNKMSRKNEAEERYKKAIELDPKSAVAHNNCALLLNELSRKIEAEEHYKKAIELNPKYAEAHNNYALLLNELSRKTEAEEHYKKAIELNPKYANPHAGFGLLLIEYDKRKDAWKEIEIASILFKETGRTTESHLIKAWFYEEYSEKNIKRKKYRESSEDANKAGEEYLRATENAEKYLKDNLTLQGNVLKAKSFVRKVPKKYWYTKILYRFGRKRDIPGIINNLKHAASYYEKASMCPIEEKKNVCNACHTSISVFSDTLSVMEAFINKRSPEIKKKEWMTQLDSARLIYEENKMKNGVALVDTLKQLIKCVDELAVHREGGLGIQKEKCGKCYNRLTEVSENLDGALNVLAEHSIEAIREYAKKQGMGGFDGNETRKSIWNNWILRGAIVVFGTIFLNLVSSKLYDLNILAIIWNAIKSLIPNT